ncbi:MAG TPA: hypothetical protein VHE12_11080 [bacterium]|nr:hypothetical protein [bacterium]
MTLIISLSLLFPVNKAISDSLSPPGVDQVLAAFASVVKDRANDVALDIIRQQFVRTLNGRAVTICGAKGKQNAVVIYLGKISETAEKPKNNNAVDTPTPNVFFERTFKLLEQNNLRLTDPVLLKAVNQDMVEFVFRISVSSMPVEDFEKMGMRDLASFSYKMVDVMASSNPDVHRLGEPMIETANGILKRFSEGFSSDISRRSSTQVVVTDADMLELASAGAVAAVSKNSSMPATACAYFYKSYKSTDADASKELSDFLNLVGSYLLADATDSQATDKWINGLLEQFSAILNKPVASDFKSREILVKVLDALEKDQSWQGSSVYVRNTLSEGFGRVVKTLLIRTYIIKKSSQVESNILGEFQRVTSTLKYLTSVGKTSPEVTGESISSGINVFADLLTGMSKDVLVDGDDLPSDERRMGNVRDVFGKISAILNMVSSRDWTSLFTFIYDQPNLVNKDHIDGRLISFARVLMQMYQAPSLDEAKKILSANLEDIASRRERFKETTVDVTALAGVCGGYEKRFLERDEQAVFGLYAPLGIQVGFDDFGLMIYPVDIGTYLTTSDSSDNPSVNDAVKIGLAGYHREKDIPVDIGAGIDYKPEFNGASDEVRVFAFTSLELPLFMLK